MAEGEKGGTLAAGSVRARYLYGEQMRLSAAGGGVDGSLNSNFAVRDVAAHPSRSGGGCLLRSPRPPEQWRESLSSVSSACLTVGGPIEDRGVIAASSCGAIA